MDLQTDRKAVARTAASCGLRSVRLPALLLELALRTTKSETNAPQPSKKSNGNVIIGNVVDNAGDNGIEVNSSDGNEISGNRVTNSSDDRSGFDGIRIGSMDSITCDNNRVASNVATDNQSVKTQIYGLNITSALCNRTFVGTNDFTGNKTGAIRDRGTNTQYGTSDETAPSVPVNLSATAMSAGRVDLSWSASNDNVGVTGYTVYRDNVVLTTVGSTTTTYQDTTVAPITTYSYTVDAFDAAGNHSAQTTPKSATTPPDTELPTDPSNLVATASGPTRVDLTWAGSTDNVAVDGYDIFRGGQLLQSIGPVTSFSDTSVTASTTYAYQVRARDTAGNVSGFSNTSNVTTPASQSTFSSAPTSRRQRTVRLRRSRRTTARSSTCCSSSRSPDLPAAP